MSPAGQQAQHWTPVRLDVAWTNQRCERATAQIHGRWDQGIVHALPQRAD